MDQYSTKCQTRQKRRTVVVVKVEVKAKKKYDDYSNQQMVWLLDVILQLLLGIEHF